MFFNPGTGPEVSGVSKIIKNHMGVYSFPLVQKSGKL